MKNETIIKLHPHIPFSKLLPKRNSSHTPQRTGKDRWRLAHLLCVSWLSPWMHEAGRGCWQAPSPPRRPATGTRSAQRAECVKATHHCRALLGTANESDRPGPPGARPWDGSVTPTISFRPHHNPTGPALVSPFNKRKSRRFHVPTPSLCPMHTLTYFITGSKLLRDVEMLL